MGKKGFTLIELLAVIIILAILMIIAVPNILSTLASSREEAFLSQAKSIYKTAQKQYLLDSMMGEAISCYDKNNLDLGSISETISFVVSVDEEDGSINNIEIIDSGQQYKASGRDINNITMKAYSENAVSCSGYTTPYTEKLLNGTDPVLGSGMVPVKLSSTGSSWTVTKADLTKRWYKYGSSQWANAVILKSSVTTVYNAGDTISHDDIEAYFVWIPKYKYKLFNMGTYTSRGNSDASKRQLIEIIFGISTTTDTDTSCASPMISGEKGNCAVGKWMTHPAFISFNSNGFWVGKFENTGTSNSITVLPGVAPLNNIMLSDYFAYLYNYNRTLDSHMVKNTEWGAIAYLSHSSYGMGKKNIYINNYYNNGYQTGCVGNGPNSAVSTTCINKWYSINGFNGSTTGNITGIYDMSGGVWEKIAALKENTFADSGFTQSIISSYDSKYFDFYNTGSTSNESFKYRILGDATGELGPFGTNGTEKISSWYEDRGIFLSSSWPVFLRGMTASTEMAAGLFNFDSNKGGANENQGSRLILTP